MEEDIYGPEYVLKINDPKLGMQGFLVVHNTALGPGKGGIRMTANVSEEEVYRLASTMTWKNSLAGIPFGGAKAGIRWPGGPDSLKKKFVQSFARALRPLLLSKYIAGPDVQSGEKEMQWFVEAVKMWDAATGKPAEYCTKHKGGKKCGIPHEFGSTGFGVAHSAAVAAKEIGLPIAGARVAIHGFGNVGTFAWEHLTAMGAKVIAVADQTGAMYSAQGFEPGRMRKLIALKKPITAYQGAERIPAEDFWGVPVDILIPASVTDVIHEGNKKHVSAKLIVEAGNIPMRENIEDELFRRGVMFVPDFVANAGGVISSYAEYAGYSPDKMFGLVKTRITSATKAVVSESLKRRENPRPVAMRLARERVEKAMRRRKDTF
ncbi:MAG: Glutamate dehydrogenase (NAD(P)+) [Parcubacteria group bacterium GW2011_GWA1_59_11]|nr:MAG: Glutamate dehydrogenase (NAD(P)+) [Parcubacteria group bacterium GW2011_GWA1_59_11]